MRSLLRHRPRNPAPPGGTTRGRPLGGLALAACVAAGVVTAPKAVSPPTGEVFAFDAKGDRKPPTEYEVKAAYLLNFLKLTNWPEGSFEDREDRLAPIELFVIGKDPFGPVLDATFEGQEAQGRTVGIRRLASLPKGSAPLPGHVVFTSLERERDRKELIAKAAGQPILVVGEAEDFAEQGGDVNFYLEGKHVRFEVNVDALDSSDLRLSPDILKLARIVRTKKPKSGSKGGRK